METPDSLRARDYMGHTIVIYWGSPQETEQNTYYTCRLEIKYRFAQN